MNTPIKIPLRAATQVTGAGTETGAGSRCNRQLSGLSAILNVSSVGVDMEAADYLDVFIDASWDDGSKWVNIGRFNRVVGVDPVADDETLPPGTTGTIAGSGGSNIVAWQNHANAIAADNTYVTAVGGYSEDPIVNDTNVLKLTNFGFAVPAGSTIDGIEVVIARKASHDSGGNTVQDYQVYLNKADDSQGTTNKADVVTPWPQAEAGATYGGAADLWDETLTPDDVNDADFGVRIRAKITQANAQATASIDNVTLKVYYTDPGAGVAATQSLKWAPNAVESSQPASVVSDIAATTGGIRNIGLPTLFRYRGVTVGDDTDITYSVHLAGHE